jgi:hypothetical protein
VRLALQARPWPLPRQNTDYFCRRSASDFSFVRPYPFFLSSSVPKRRFANASTGIGLLSLGVFKVGRVAD